MQLEFKECEIAKKPDLPPANKYPFFIVALWKGNTEYTIRPKKYSSAHEGKIIEEIRRLDEAGWKHIFVCRLPDFKL